MTQMASTRHSGARALMSCSTDSVIKQSISLRENRGAPHQSFARLPGVKPIVASIEGKPFTADGLPFLALCHWNKSTTAMYLDYGSPVTRR